MLIKSRLIARDSPFHRLTAVTDHTSLNELIAELIEQWNLPNANTYSLLWTVTTGGTTESLIIGSQKEWQSFLQTHLTRKDEVIELQIVPANILATYLPLERFAEQVNKRSGEESAIASISSESKASAPPRFAFHSVEPQPIGARQQRIDQQNNQQQSLKMNAAPLPVSEREDEAGELQAEEEMSDYDRVLARSRMQGEGLNQFFGTLMARRAGNAVTNDERPTSAEEESLVKASNPTDLPTSPAASPIAATAGPTRTAEVLERNAWLENAWEERLREMGHGPNSGSPYARLRVGRGKERQISEAAEASTSQIRRRADERNHLQEARENIAPLQERSMNLTEGNTFNRMQTLSAHTYSLPTSRPGSTSETYESRGSGRKSLRWFRRKGQGRRSLMPFASQPPSQTPSGAATPMHEEENTLSRRRRTISFRSLSESLLRERRSNRIVATPDQEEQGEHVANSAPTTQPARGEMNGGIIGNRSNGVVLSEELQSAEEGCSPIPPKLQDNSSQRPSLLRAAHSAPLSATAVNLSSAGGITLHISSRGLTSLMQAEEEELERESKKDLFDLMLPREIRIKCFKWLVRTHEEDALRRTGRPGNARSQAAIGREAAVRELMRLTRVSRTWQSLLLDGQLWTEVDSALLTDISQSCLLRLAHSAGPFIKHMDLQHLPNLSSSLLLLMAFREGRLEEEATRHKSMTFVPTLSHTREIRMLSLSSLNLKGCRQLSTSALHSALVRLPSLKDLRLSSLDSVTNDTCLLLGSCLPTLCSLDVSRCPNVSGKGIALFIQAAQGALYDKALFSSVIAAEGTPCQEDTPLPLCELRAAGCAEVDSRMMSSIGKNLRHLQVLDLSYVSDLRDDAMGALVAHPGPKEDVTKESSKTTSQLAALDNCYDGPFITLTPRQAGGDIALDEAHHRRLLPALRHLSLSSCRRLSDRSCVLLAHAVPNLRFFEMANIGPNLKDAGLIKLFETMPLIERIDLEGASEITGKVVEAITPDIAYVESIVPERNGRRRRSTRRHRQDAASTSVSPKGQIPPPPGAYLTHLILSHASKPEVETLLHLIERCPRLLHLQLDETRANDNVLKEFIQINHQREVRGAYINLIDCRSLTRSAHLDGSHGLGSSVRPREGRSGRLYRPLGYNDGTFSRSVTQGSNSTMTDECDDRLVVVKTFFTWETRSQQRRTQQRRAQRALTPGNGGGPTIRILGRSRRDSLTAALTFLGGQNQHQRAEEDGEGNGRWSRFTQGMMNQGDEGEDARACIVM